MCMHRCRCLDHLTRQHHRQCRPLPPMGEHNAAGGPSGTFLLPPCALCKHGGIVPKHGHTTAQLGGWHPCPDPSGCQRHLVPLTMSCPLRTWGGTYASGFKQPLVLVVGTCTHIIWGVNTNIFRSPSYKHGEGCTPTAWPTMSSAGATRIGRPTYIVEWAAHTSTNKLLSYWDATVSPSKRTLYWEKNAGPLINRHHLSIKGILLANEQKEAKHAQWVRTHLRMSISPPHPHHQMGENMGPMAPSPANHWVTRPSPSKVRPTTPVV